MLSYKLAKQLKEAGSEQELKVGDWIYTGLTGHPRKGIPYQYAPTLIITHPEDWERMDYIKIPTLSELIEACGDKFWKLKKGKFSWFAYPKNPEDVGHPELDNIGIGSKKNPEEAVAKLRLELNKKK